MYHFYIRSKEIAVRGGWKGKVYNTPSDFSRCNPPSGVELDPGWRYRSQMKIRLRLQNFCKICFSGQDQIRDFFLGSIRIRWTSYRFETLILILELQSRFEFSIFWYQEASCLNQILVPDKIFFNYISLDISLFDIENLAPRGIHIEFTQYTFFSFYTALHILTSIYTL